ncbi:MAG TPA: M20/M25/M40 family metallo-hydrolase [Longimicrobiales bacterium]|nr:M20/M25/M40 family metallo-hydrolase [Longimicrobiales bacterium]
MDAAALTRTLVGIPSVNPSLEASGSGELRMAMHIAGLLEDWGFTAGIDEFQPGRPNVLARLGDGGPTLLLNGHLDTVGVAGMTVDPFGADSTPDRIVGRGAADMKAGLAAILAAAHSWAASPSSGTLVVALTGDEEHASLGMQRLVAEGVEADAAVVTEPTELAVMPAHKGFQWVEVTFQGRAAHGSRPEVGVDAVRHAAALLQEMDSLEVGLRGCEPHPLLGHGSFHAGTVAGGATWSVYPERCVLTLERRTLPDEPDGVFLGEVEACLARLGGRIPELDAVSRQDLVRPGSDVSPDHPLVRGLLQAAEEEGHPPRVEGMTAWVDAAFLNRAGIPAVCFGPGSIARAHTADEEVPADEVRAASRILERFVRSFLAG